MKIVMCKYRNEYGRKMRKVYESHRGGYEGASANPTNAAPTASAERW